MIDNIRRIIINNKFNLIIFLFYVILCVIALSYHELWRDESRVWLFVTTYDFNTLINNIRFDGHPYLWYAFISFFYKIGLPMSVMGIFSVTLCSVAVLFFLFKSPFNNLTKILFVFSSGMVYFLPVVARNYALIPILIFLLAYFYRDRLNKPYLYLTVLILLSQTHSLIWGLCLMCSIVFCIECITKFLKEKNVSHIITPIILFVYSFAMYCIYLDVFYNNTWNTKVSEKFFTAIINIFSHFYELSFLFDKMNFNKTALVILIVLFLGMSFLFIKRSKISLLFLWSSVFYILFIFKYVWWGGIPYQKFFLIILSIIFCYWIIDNKNTLYDKALQYILIAFLSVLFFNPPFITVLNDEIKNSYTNTIDVCKFIDTINDEIIAITAYWEESVLADNFLVHTKNTIDFIRVPPDKYDVGTHVLEKGDITVTDEFPKYLITTRAIMVPDELHYKRIAPFPKDIFKTYNTNEYYSIYEKIE